MISRQIKPLAVLEQSFKPIVITHKEMPWRMIRKGYEPHYQWINKHRSKLDVSDKMYCYDYEKVSIALAMAKTDSKSMTYVDSRRYQTIAVIPKISNRVQNFSAYQNDQVPQEVHSKALDILKNHNFIVRASFLDIHPLMAYEKVCNYLMMQPNSKVYSLFKNHSITEKSLSSSFILQPLLTKIRNKFLVTEQLKLTRIKRRQQVEVTSLDISSYLSEWQKTVQWDTINGAKSCFSDQAQARWAISNQLGEEITLSDLLRDKYRNHYYATWQ